MGVSGKEKVIFHFSAETVDFKIFVEFFFLNILQARSIRLSCYKPGKYKLTEIMNIFFSEGQNKIKPQVNIFFPSMINLSLNFGKYYFIN